MFMEWYIKLHRQFIDWERYDDINTKTLFLHILIKANYSDKKWRWILIKRWTFITSISKLSIDSNLTIAQTRFSLNKLILTNEVAKLSKINYTLLEVINYDKYQSNDLVVANELANEWQTSSKRVATTKNKKNKKNSNIIINNNITSICHHKKIASWNLRLYMKEKIDIQFFMEKHNVEQSFIIEQLKEFYLHRSEKNINWKKEKWQMEKTFDVNRRFHKRLSNNKKWNKLSSKNAQWKKKLYIIE